MILPLPIIIVFHLRLKNIHLRHRTDAALRTGYRLTARKWQCWRSGARSASNPFSGPTREAQRRHSTGHIQHRLAYPAPAAYICLLHQRLYSIHCKMLQYSWWTSCRGYAYADHNFTIRSPAYLFLAKVYNSLKIRLSFLIKDSPNQSI